MPLVYHGYTFEEMVKSIKENEKLKEEISCLETKLKFYKGAYMNVKKIILWMNDKIETMEEDYRLLEDSNCRLLTKYDELVKTILDAVSDCSDM